MPEDNRIILLDANSLIYRAFYALPLLKNSRGQYTNAVYGFMNMLFNLLEKENPAYLLAAFDLPTPTFRHKVYPDYKGHRQKTPDELGEQIPLIKEILAEMQIKVIEQAGFEADDIIGTCCRQATDAGIDSLIVTGDTDALQLVSDKVKVALTRKGITNVDTFDPERVKEKYGLSPEQIIDFKALKGDSSDNIPGVPGIGDKTATKLLQKFVTLDEVLENTAALPGKKVPENLRVYREQALMSRELATICCQVPLDLHLPDCKRKTYDTSRLKEIFTDLEFKRLLDKISLVEARDGEEELAEMLHTPTPTLARTPYSAIAVVRTRSGSYSSSSPHQGGGGSDRRPNLNVVGTEISEENLSLVAKKMATEKEIYLFFASSNGKEFFKRKDVPEILALGVGEDNYYITLVDNSAIVEKLFSVLGKALENPLIKKITSQGKFLYHYLAEKRDFTLSDNTPFLTFDIVIAAYLLQPDRKDFSLVALARDFLIISGTPAEPEFPSSPSFYLHLLRKLYYLLNEKISDLAMEELMFDLELPLMPVLAAMERQGMKVDSKILEDMGEKAKEQEKLLRSEIYTLAGEEFNINSPKQLRVILFEKLKLPVIKKTKTGASTDASVLEELASRHDIVAKILQHRQLFKLRTTYLEGLSALIDPLTGRIHTTFNQTVTVTGRLSSTEPNLQNIPVRQKEGRLIRRAFIPGENLSACNLSACNAQAEEWLLLAADYSQIELRLMAHLSEDEGLRQAFREGQDIHKRTAAEVFHVPLEKVTETMRSRAKAINFGIIYGMSDYGLAQNLGITRQEAAEFIERYFQRYPGVKNYLDDTIKKAKEKGFVTTMLNRRRYLPEINHSNFNLRNFAKRMAINMPVQGTAADVIKRAMIQVAVLLTKENLKARMLLQVHDELVFEVPRSELDRTALLVKDTMENVISLEVPLIVDVKYGYDWWEI